MIEIGIMTDGMFPEEPRKGGSGSYSHEMLKRRDPVVKVDFFYQSEKKKKKVKIKDL